MSEIDELKLQGQEALDQIITLKAKIARLVEVGDKLTNESVVIDWSTDTCRFCKKDVESHATDCPVALWNKEAHE